MSGTDVVVGRIGRPHGVSGEVSVEPRTDEPERRFAPGQVMVTQAPRGGAPHGPGRPERLTVEESRRHQGRLLVRFEEIADRTAAEASRGLLLVATVEPGESPADLDEFYDHQLVGLRAVTTDGRDAGRVIGVLHPGAQDLLRIATDHGEVLVPFVTALVPVVDLAQGCVQVADRPGLLRPDEAVE